MTRRWFLRLPSFCILVGICLIVGAAYCYFAPSRSFGAALAVASTDIEIPVYAAAQRREVVLHLHNHSGQPVRVLGVVEC